MKPLRLSGLVALVVAAALGCAHCAPPAAPPAATVPSAPPVPPAKSAAPSSAPVAASAKPVAPAAPAAAKVKATKCAAGTSLVWADNVSAKCLRACDGTDASCPKGQSCIPGNVADDDGNPIPHDVTNVCLGAGAGAAPAPAATTAPTPSAGTLVMPNPTHLTCPAGYSDQGGVLAHDPWNSCNKICTTKKDCKAPFTCQSLTGDAEKVCAKN